jgi:hypothetical protein
LAEEGSDASREQETLIALSANLSQLYARQAKMRSSSWRSPLPAYHRATCPRRTWGEIASGRGGASDAALLASEVLFTNDY